MLNGGSYDYRKEKRGFLCVYNQGENKLRVSFNCEVCGEKKSRIYAANKKPKHFFCSVTCQNEWQKTREDIVMKNKDPVFRNKVSEGLKRRKQLLGDEYHSQETKQKIGAATIQHWESYDAVKRDYLTCILRNNAIKKRTFGDYDNDWHILSDAIRKGQVCHRCGKADNICVHHIIPVSSGGSRSQYNLVPLCSSCHKIVENEGKKINELINDWEIVRLLLRERLLCSI